MCGLMPSIRMNSSIAVTIICLCQGLHNCEVILVHYTFKLVAYMQGTFGSSKVGRGAMSVGTVP